MRLKRVKIQGYKNLTDFEINFETDNLINIFVGKNGSGKSNLLESLIEVFDSVFDDKKKGRPTGFNYSLTYEIDGEEIDLAANADGLTINGAQRSTIGQTAVPESLVIYYSGQNDTVANLVRRYRDRFQASIKGAEVLESPKIIGIGPDYKELLLAIMLLLPEDNVARKYITSKLGVTVSGGTAKLTLQRPSFAKKGVDYDPLDPKMVFWGTQGTAKDFLDDLITCVDGEFNIRDLYKNETDVYEIPIDITLFREKFNGEAVDLLFRKFHALRIIGMMQSLFLPMRLENDSVIPATGFSDGQFQSVYLFTISELFKNTNCLTLLDEPDAFMHPEWQNQYLSQIKEISGDAARSNHILMTSHSASTIAANADCPIHLLSWDGTNVIPRACDKQELIHELSAGVIAFTEDEARLNISHIIRSTDRPVLFTEGIADEIILETAWNKLNPTQACPFEIQAGFGCKFLRAFLNDNEGIAQFNTRKLFALFDFDSAFDEWNRCGQTMNNNASTCKTKRLNGREHYALLLPIADAHPLRHQVINPATEQDYGGKSLYEIEHLFYGVEGTEPLFRADTSRTDNFIDFCGDKVNFAKVTVAGIDAQHFEGFRPIFEFVVNKISEPA